MFRKIIVLLSLLYLLTSSNWMYGQGEATKPSEGNKSNEGEKSAAGPSGGISAPKEISGSIGIDQQGNKIPRVDFSFPEDNKTNAGQPNTAGQSNTTGQPNNIGQQGNGKDGGNGISGSNTDNRPDVEVTVDNNGHHGSAEDHTTYESVLVRNIVEDYIEKYSLVAIELGKAAIQEGEILKTSSYIRMTSTAFIQVGSATLIGLQFANAVYEAQQGNYGSAICFGVGVSIGLIPGGALVGPIAGSVCSIGLLTIRAYNAQKLKELKK